MHEWYVSINGQEIGPVPTDFLVNFLRQHRDAEIYVWRVGFDQWELASEVPELMIPAPPQPKTSADKASTPQPHIARSRWQRWAKVGALIAIAITFLSLLTREKQSLNVPFLIGYFAGSAVMGGLIGFVIGLIADCFSALRHRRAEDQIAPSPTNLSERNFIYRHWRGTLPLWVSYWVIGFLGSWAIVLVQRLLVAIFKVDQGYNPTSIFFLIIAAWAVAVTITLWQIVGTWRSADLYIINRAQRGLKAPWASLAKMALVIGALASASSLLKEGLPQITATYRMAFQDDPEIPPYTLRIMRDGTEVEIVGGFKYGLTDDFEKILRASRQVKVVHLDSIGGRIGEGKRLFALIKREGLNTYVSSKCLSACTLAFAGGKERFLHQRASLGFHRGAFAGVEESGLDSEQAKIFKEAGFGADFITRALTTPHKDMWRPSADVLLQARVATSVVDSNRFAVSGLGADLTKEQLERKFAQAAPGLQALKDRLPKQYEAMMSGYHEAVLKGKTESEAQEAVRSKFLPIISSLLPLADDDVLISFTKLLAKQYKALNEVNPSYCFEYATVGSKNYSSLLPKDIFAEELKLQEKIIRSATKRPKIEDAELTVSRSLLVKALLVRGFTEAEIDYFSQNKIPASRHGDYCRYAIAMFEEISGLPARNAAPFIRDIFARK